MANLFKTLFAIILTTSVSHSDEIFHSNLYADMLIEEFDKRLESNPDENLLNSELYSKIIASRIFIENTHTEPMKYKSANLLQLKDGQGFIETVLKIDQMAVEVQELQNLIKSRESRLSVVYPSTGRDGNLTGNTFPKGVWSLTYDDGPKSGTTKQIVDELYKNGIEASFFMLMRQVNRYQNQAQYVLDANMELALHSYTHKDLNKASPAVMKYEVKTALKEMTAFGKRKINLFRLPYGSGMRNSTLRQVIANSGLIHVFWNVDTLDWKDKNPQSIFKRTLAQMKKTPKQSGIILFHDIHKQTVEATRLMMDYIHQNNLKICPVGKVISYLNGQMQDCLN